MKKFLRHILISLLCLLIVLLSFSPCVPVSAEYTGKITYTSSKPIDNAGYLNQFSNDLESLNISFYSTQYKTMYFYSIPLAFTSYESLMAVYNYFINSSAIYIPLNFYYKLRFDDEIIQLEFSYDLRIVKKSVYYYFSYSGLYYLIVDCYIHTEGLPEIFITDSLILSKFSSLFSYNSSYNNNFDFSFQFFPSHDQPIKINNISCIFFPYHPDYYYFNVGFVSKTLSTKISFTFKNEYKIGKILLNYNAIGFKEEDYLESLSGASLNIAMSVNDGEIIYANSGTSKYNFITGSNRYLLLTLDDYVKLNKLSLYFDSVLSSSLYETDYDIYSDYPFSYSVNLSYLQVYDAFSDVIAPGGSYDSSRLINYKSVSWYDIPGHLSNFMVWLLYDCPIIAPLFSMIYTMFSFSTVFIDNFVLFSSLGVVFSILAGIFGFMILIKVLKE